MRQSNNQNFVKTVNVNRTKKDIDRRLNGDRLHKIERTVQRKNKMKRNKFFAWQVFEYRLKESIRYDADRKVTSVNWNN